MKTVNKSCNFIAKLVSDLLCLQDNEVIFYSIMGWEEISQYYVVAYWFIIDVVLHDGYQMNYRRPFAAVLDLQCIKFPSYFYSYSYYYCTVLRCLYLVILCWFRLFVQI